MTQPQPHILAGIDIGGTKCAVTLGETVARADGPSVRILAKRRFATLPPAQTLAQCSGDVADLLAAAANPPLAAIGISCGGPLDSRRGLILSPPNLPGWDHIDVVTPLEARFGVPVALQNDANAGALAEWQWGAGRGVQNLIFLTFGTGMGAGLILDGRLYRGTNDMAGEVGHLRLEPDGPVGYGKAGSFEGFCSGGGIAQLGRTFAEAALAAGQTVAYCPTRQDLAAVSAEKVGRAAQAGDATARAVFAEVAQQLGRGLAILVDILNPERIVLGSIYGRQQPLLEELTWAALRAEALPLSLSVCEILPAGLGENVGDYASLAVALQCAREMG
jgi:glucokinase